MALQVDPFPVPSAAASTSVRPVASRRAAASSTIGLVAVCMLAVGMGAVGMTNEGYVSLHGDMPRHLMNGVFVADLVRDRPFDSLDTLLEYARMYYARYPALSLGHHPPLLAVALAPAYALFGISIASARVVQLLAFVAATALLYQLVRRIHGTTTAVAASAIFVTSPHILILTHAVLAEMLALALVLGSAYYLLRFCEDPRRRGALVGFIVTALLSLSAKQVAIFVFPVFILVAIAVLGPRRLLHRKLLVVAGVTGIIALPLVGMTLALSPVNVDLAMNAWSVYTVDVVALLRSALTAQFEFPVLALIAVGVVRTLVGALRGKDRRALLWVLWAAVVFAGMVVFAPFEPARYSIYAVPALATLAALAITGWRQRALALLGVVIAVFAVGIQGYLVVLRPRLLGAEGYEAAARYVVNSKPGPTVLFSGDIDSGYFVFFIRKHDPDRRLVVLRADKVLTTSLLGRSIEDRIGQPEEIYAILRRFGTRFIVIEDRPSESRVLEWLRQELLSSRFVERVRIPIATSDVRLRGSDLVVYEYLDAASPDPDAVLSINLPVVDQSVSVKLSDLISRRYLR